MSDDVIRLGKLFFSDHSTHNLSNFMTLNGASTLPEVWIVPDGTHPVYTGEKIGAIYHIAIYSEFSVKTLLKSNGKSLDECGEDTMVRYNATSVKER